MSDAKQRALEKALAELVGGRKPPDLTFRILTAARQNSGRVRGPRRVRSGARARMAGTLLGVAAAAAVWFALAPDDARFPFVAVGVTSAELTWESRDRVTRSVGVGTSMAVLPRIGDQLVADAHDVTTVGLDAFGVLSMRPGTRLEIKEMKWQDFGVGFGSGSMTVAVLFGGVTWFAGGYSAGAVAGESLVLPLSAQMNAADGGRARAEQLEVELEEARAEIQRLSDVDRRRVVLGSEVAGGEEEPSPEPEPDFEPLQIDPEIDRLLGELDWQAVGAGSVELVDALRRLMAVLAEGGEVSHEMLGDLERLKGTLHSFGAAVDDQGVLDGADFDTRVRHPIVGANWITAVLQFAGIPFDDVQRRSLEDLAHRYTVEDQQRRAGYGDGVPDLQHYLDELEMQDRFYRDVGYVMNAGQRELLSAGEFEGRVGAKLVGTSSLAWGEWVQAVVVRTRGDFVTSMTTGFANKLELQGAERDALGALVRDWAEAFPQELWDQPFDSMDRYGGYQVERVKAAARLQLQFFDRISRTMNLSSQQREALKGVRSLVVPYQKG